MSRFEPFRRSYRGGGGSGFGGNAWVSLMGGAAQGLLSAQKNRAELVRQAQEDALRRAAEGRADASAKREEERLEMARKAQEAASKKRMTEEETRIRELREAREAEAEHRNRRDELIKDWTAKGYGKDWTPSEMFEAAEGVASGKYKPDVLKPKAVSAPKLKYETMTPTDAAAKGRGLINAWEEQERNRPVDPAEAGPNFVGPPKAMAQPDRKQFLQDLTEAVEYHRRVLASMPQGTQEWWKLKEQLAVEEAAQKELEAELRANQRGDFATGGFEYGNVDTSSGR